MQKLSRSEFAKQAIPIRFKPLYLATRHFGQILYAIDLVQNRRWLSSHA
jgi:hypothetical protein